MTTRVAIAPSEPWITPNRINTAGQYVLAAFSILGVTFVLFRLQLYLGNVNVSIAYLVVVLCCAAIAQPGVTLFCGLLSFICYDFFLVPPVFTLQVDAPLRLLDPLAVAAVAIVTCVMAGRSRQRAVQSMVYQEADQARATLLHLVSHNLRTPLATIKTALTSLIALDQLPPDSLQLLLDADQECDRLNRLIGNVLHLSRMDARAIRIHRDWNALDEVISAVFTRWPQAVKGGSLRAHMPDSVPLVSFDFSLVEAILGNLVENAFHRLSSGASNGFNQPRRDQVLCRRCWHRRSYHRASKVICTVLQLKLQQNRAWPCRVQRVGRSAWWSYMGDI